VETEHTRKSASDLDRAEFDKVVANLPLATYSAGESVLTAGSKSGRLFILKKGTVAIFKESVEIVRVNEPGAVFGELSATGDFAVGRSVESTASDYSLILDRLIAYGAMGIVQSTPLRG
jgi:signal-transduction protein with cAMP-binding, CBS, and nucleotidyltransferase domain